MPAVGRIRIRLSTEMMLFAAAYHRTGRRRSGVLRFEFGSQIKAVDLWSSRGSTRLVEQNVQVRGEPSGGQRRGFFTNRMGVTPSAAREREECKGK